MATHQSGAGSKDPIAAKRKPSSKRLLLALGFLDCVKARLDPFPFLCPQGLWLWLGVTTGIKRAQDDSFFFGKRRYSKRLLLAHGFLDYKKAGIVENSVSHGAPRKARPRERPNVCSLGITNVRPLRGQVRG